MASRFDLDGFSADAHEMDLDDLGVVVEIASAVWRERAAAAGDVDALVEEAFDSGFGSDGLALTPQVRGGLVVCCGSQVGSAGWSSTHRCRFVTVDGDWVWESPLAVADVMRPGPSGVRTATVVAAAPGAVFSVVTAKSSRGAHRRTALEVFRFDGETLKKVDASAAKIPDSHR